jgi:Arc/MetJ-type ribon-helix-helix transcriptional regulator
MTTELKPEIEAIIQKQLQSGMYSKPEEVIERALEFLAAEEDWLVACLPFLDLGPISQLHRRLRSGNKTLDNCSRPARSEEGCSRTEDALSSVYACQ